MAQNVLANFRQLHIIILDECDFDYLICIVLYSIFLCTTYISIWCFFGGEIGNEIEKSESFLLYVKKNEEEKSMNLVPHIVHTAARYTRKYNCQLITPKFD